MVYQLLRPADHETVRQGALPLPSLGVEGPRLYPDPLLVWGSGLTADLPLGNSHREVVWTLHNAGGAPCQLTEVRCGAGWLTAEYESKTLPPDGRPVPVRLRVWPEAGLTPGEHTARVLIKATWPGGGEQILEESFTLRVPDGPVPWFDDEVAVYDGPYRETEVKIASRVPVRVCWGGHVVAEPKGERPVALYPGDYQIDGTRGDLAMVDVPGHHLTPVTVPGPFRVPGPTRTVRLRNAGSKPLVGRLVSGAPWLVVRPETIELSPGEHVDLSVECRDDGRYWQESDSSILLRSRFTDEALAELPVSRRWELPGPRPVPGATGAGFGVEFPPVQPGGTAVAVVAIRNAGDQALEVRPEFAGTGQRIQPGETASLNVAVGPPDTLSVKRAEGRLTVITNARLPYWRFLAVPYAVDVVGASLTSTSLDFGTVRFRQQQMKVLKVVRTDHRRSRLVIDFPPELQEVFRLQGDLLFMRNFHPRPAIVDQEFEVRDEALGGALLGKVHIKGHCLVPKLAVTVPPVTLVPGETTTIQLRVEDAGGGLELGKVLSDQPGWAVVKKHELKVAVTVKSSKWDRGRKQAILTFHSNDFVNPVQEHLLTVELKPTISMRLLDGLLWCVRPLRLIWEPIRRLFRT